MFWDDIRDDSQNALGRAVFAEVSEVGAKEVHGSGLNVQLGEKLLLATPLRFIEDVTSKHKGQLHVVCCWVVGRGGRGACCFVVGWELKLGGRAFAGGHFDF